MMTPIKTAAPMTEPAAIPTMPEVLVLEASEEEVEEAAALVVEVVDAITLLGLYVLVTVVATAVRVLTGLVVLGV